MWRQGGYCMSKEELVETILEFMYNRCLRCDYKDCKKKEGNIEELEMALQTVKNKNLMDLSNMLGVKV